MPLINIASPSQPKAFRAIPPDSESPSAPTNPDIHLFEASSAPFLFVVNGSQVYGIGASEYARLLAAVEVDDHRNVAKLLHDLKLDSPPAIDDSPIANPPVRALSLAVAQKCNLACTYCYAQAGEFGGPSKLMPLDVAYAAVDRLFVDAQSGDRVNLAFLGGEPLYARSVVRAATEKAASIGAARNIQTTFSITTNGTLVNSDDADFFESHGFAVTISVDGVGETHDRQRSFKGGNGSFDRLLNQVRPLLRSQSQMQVSARVTATPRNLELRKTLDELLGLGFHSVGFSPMLSAPSGLDEMGYDELKQMLAQMIDCGQEFERRVEQGQRYGFANMMTAMTEIHRGTHRPYPCGAGAGYLGVSADGDLAACHRFVNDDAGALGTLVHGIDSARQNAWLADRHVHRQEPCRTCWARYLCGGGCHHEVIHRGRPACGYIRGWLHYCLQAYVRILDRRPEYLTGG